MWTNQNAQVKSGRVPEKASSSLLAMSPVYCYLLCAGTCDHTEYCQPGTFTQASGPKVLIGVWLCKRDWLDHWLCGWTLPSSCFFREIRLISFGHFSVCESDRMVVLQCDCLHLSSAGGLSGGVRGPALSRSVRRVACAHLMNSCLLSIPLRDPRAHLHP